jgi:hypothetical protein
VILGGDHRRALLLPGTAVAVIIFERCGVTVERVSGQAFGTSESRRPFDVDLRRGSYRTSAVTLPAATVIPSSW